MPAEPNGKSMPSRQIAVRLIALWCWSYLVWMLLTWTLTVEQLLFGAAIAVAVAVTQLWVFLSHIERFSRPVRGQDVDGLAVVRSPAAW